MMVPVYRVVGLNGINSLPVLLNPEWVVFAQAHEDTIDRTLLRLQDGSELVVRGDLPTIHDLLNRRPS